MGGLQSFGGGDCLVAAGFLLEASTPFVSLRKILAILGLQKSNWYIINGLIMTLVFFACRVIFFPVVYYLYSVEHGKYHYTSFTRFKLIDSNNDKLLHIFRFLRYLSNAEVLLNNF
jgi:hypothetical protein